MIPQKPRTLQMSIPKKLRNWASYSANGNQPYPLLRIKKRTMMKKDNTHFLVAAVLVAIVFSCQTKKETDGPFFGSGFHNGWADQNSIVIWTRLTQNPDGNAEGAQF